MHLRIVPVSISFIALTAAPVAVSASPTMIRLGYSNCTACHFSPQGGGLLTAYGKGAYTRLGFGKWGVLAEHDLTSHTPRSSGLARSSVMAGHTQVFFAPYEWLVTSVGGEHLVIDTPSHSHVYRLAPTVQARLSANLTAIFYTRDMFTGVSSTRSRTYGIQVAVKTGS